MLPGNDSGKRSGVSNSVVEETIRVRYAETDMMGHAYYANYLVWFEQARTALFRSRGLPYSEVESKGFKLPVVEVWARYKGEAKYDDELTVRIWVSEVKRSSVKVEYEVVNGTSGKVITEGYTWHVCVNHEFKVSSFPEFMRKAFEPVGRQ